MVALTPPTRLPAALNPLPGPKRYGLFNVASPQFLPDSVTVDAGQVDPSFRAHAFGSGFFYDPVGCGESHLYPVECNNETPPDEKVLDPNSPEVPVLPFVVYSTLVCGMPGPVEYFVGKNLTRLYSTEQAAVEAALWTGDGGNGPWIDDAATSPYGVPVDVGAGGTFANVVDAVAALEQHAYGAAGANYGYNAVLHSIPAVAAYGAADFQFTTAHAGYDAVWGVSMSDASLRTHLGTKWSFGGGYPGTGPDGAAPGPGETYIWITGNVSVWQDQEWTPPDPRRSQFDRSLNQLKLIAERRYLATFDCFAAYALVSIPKVAVP